MIYAAAPAAIAGAMRVKALKAVYGLAVKSRGGHCVAFKGAPIFRQRKEDEMLFGRTALGLAALLAYLH
jgi:hypothetical protein